MPPYGVLPHATSHQGYYSPHPVQHSSPNQGFAALGSHNVPLYYNHVQSTFQHQDDDSVSDYSANSNRPHGFFADATWWQYFTSSDAGLSIQSIIKEIPSVCWNAALGLDQSMGQDTYYIDSGASTHLTDNLDHLTNVRCLQYAIPLSGINKSHVVSLTHVGNLPWMPPGMQQCFYGKDLGARLIVLNN
jgi:hypothetical protein